MENSLTQGSGNQIERLIDMTLRSINEADTEAAAQRVQEMRAQGAMADLQDAADAESNNAGLDNAGLDNSALVERLIKQKTMQAGLVGAVTSGAAIVPGLGTLATLTVGVATDVGMTLKMQSDLVLEIAAAHGHVLTEEERRNAMMLVTGANLGSERLVNQASRRLARKVGERFAGRAFVKLIPFVGIAAAAGANMVTTYAIGKRADAYFGLGPEAGNLDQSLRALSGVDERKLAEWLSELMAGLSQLLGVGARRAGRTATRLGRSTSAAVVGGVNALRIRRQRRAARRLDADSSTPSQEGDEG